MDISRSVTLASMIEKAKRVRLTLLKSSAIMRFEISKDNDSLPSDSGDGIVTEALAR